jgi:hypothetical protein
MVKQWERLPLQFLLYKRLQTVQAYIQKEERERKKKKRN